ncbi:MAG TPA: hypothetical protein VJJ22_03220 [Candidatus Paceibacterota bacterium]
MVKKAKGGKVGRPKGSKNKKDHKGNPRLGILLSNSPREIRQILEEDEHRRTLSYYGQREDDNYSNRYTDREYENLESEGKEE